MYIMSEESRVFKNMVDSHIVSTTSDIVSTTSDITVNQMDRNNSDIEKNSTEQEEDEIMFFTLFQKIDKIIFESQLLNKSIDILVDILEGPSSNEFIMGANKFAMSANKFAIDTKEAIVELCRETDNLYGDLFDGSSSEYSSADEYVDSSETVSVDSSYIEDEEILIKPVESNGFEILYEEEVKDILKDIDSMKEKVD